jgi:hypothetical protein
MARVVFAAGLLAMGAGALIISSAGAAKDLLSGLTSGLNDLLSLGQGGGQAPTRAPVVRRAEPPLVAVPRAVCGPGSRREPGIQGRVPASAIASGAAAQGYNCNLTLISHHGTSGGFKVFRYVDAHGHECAYYDTALLYPINALRLTGASEGVTVLDMSDPAHPVKTATLASLPMLSPHESLNLNPERGLLAAVLGNPATYPGLVSIYDVRADCRHPVLQSTALVARFGHESGFSPDGNTFYATGTAVQAISAIDVKDPAHPRPLWVGNLFAHGMTISNDGNRAYVADPVGGDLLILDVSEIQARKPDPQAREISRLTWGPATIPQNAIPITIKGKPYVLEFDEYSGRAKTLGSSDTVGAARIIDVSDEARPRVVSNIRLEVNQPANHRAADADPGAQSPVQGYAAHYCNVPTRVDPQIVACSFIASGLRVFDIRDPLAPREIAYFVAPPRAAPENGAMPSDFAMSAPAFAPERREIWYSDGGSGFYALRLAASLWTVGTELPGPAPACVSRRGFLVKVHVPRHATVSSVRAVLAGKPAGLVRRGRSWYVRVEFGKHPRRVVRLVVQLTLRDGRKLTSVRAYDPCVRKMS